MSQSHWSITPQNREGLVCGNGWVNFLCSMPQIFLLFIKGVQISYFGHWLICNGSMPLNLGQLGYERREREKKKLIKNYQKKVHMQNQFL
jgi:hypothetical protein